MSRAKLLIVLSGVLLAASAVAPCPLVFPLAAAAHLLQALAWHSLVHQLLACLAQLLEEPEHATQNERRP